MKKRFTTLLILIYAITCLPLAAFATTEDYTDMGPYIPYAGIERKKVVTYATKTDVPAALASKVKQIYPDGKMKAVLFSTDDRMDPNAIWFAEELKRNGLVGVCNLNAHDVNNAPSSAHTLTQAQRNALVGMEIGNHTYTHWSESYMSKDRVKYEMGESKYELERVFGVEVAGYIPAGDENRRDPEPLAPASWRNAYYKYIGHRYTKRYTNVTNSTVHPPQVASTLKYTVPTNFYDWVPTSEINGFELAQDTESTGDGSKKVADYYIDTYPETDLSLLFLNTHAGWAGFNEGAAGRNNHIYICNKTKNNISKLWNPTPIEYTDYMNALWNTTATLSEDASGNITATNTSGAETVWLKIYGEEITIPPGKSITVDSSGQVTGSVDVQMVYGLPEARDKFEPLNPHIMSAPDDVVTVQGNLNPMLAGSSVTLLMVPINADVNALTDADLKYVWQDEVASDGTYQFQFIFDGMTFHSETGICDNYKVFVNHGGVDVTPTVTNVSMNRKVTKFNLSVNQRGDDAIADAIVYIDNTIGLPNTPYVIVLACYSDTKLLDLKVANRTIVAGLMENTISMDIPEGTVRIKVFVMDSLERVIPLAKGATHTLQTTP